MGVFNTAVSVDGLNPPELLSLVLRRAALLQACESSAVAANSFDAPADELLRVTEELQGQLASEPMAVRRLTLSEPGDLVERLAFAEPVHPFATSSPLGRQADVADRFAADRRCYVLEHPLLGGHPLNVVWVALVDQTPTAIAQILNPERTPLDPSEASTATFYSIWNVEPGLSGIPGGASLLFGAIDLLKSEFPAVTQFLTLSPTPGFREWASERQSTEAPQEDLLRGCAQYLCSLGTSGLPIDPVARFHLGNGARLLQIQAVADLSTRGIAQSFGLMANYSYEPEDRSANQAALLAGNIAIGDQVRRLLR